MHISLNYFGFGFGTGC